MLSVEGKGLTEQLLDRVLAYEGTLVPFSYVDWSVRLLSDLTVVAWCDVRVGVESPVVGFRDALLMKRVALCDC